MLTRNLDTSASICLCQLALVFSDILRELTKAYSSNGAHAKPQQMKQDCSSVKADAGSSEGDGEFVVSLLAHMFDILEGSALIPVLEVRCYCGFN